MRQGHRGVARPMVASGVPILDAAGVITATEVESALAELAVKTRYAFTTGDVDNSTLVLSDVTGLAFSVLAATTYVFEFFCYTSSVVNTTGLVLAVNGPASPTYLRYASNTVGASNALFAAGTNAFEGTITSTANSAVAAAPVVMVLTGHLVNGVNAGTVQLRMRSEIDTSQATVQRGSWGRITRLN